MPLDPALRAKRRRTLLRLSALLAVCAIAIVTLATRVPLPMRLMTAGIDLVAAAALWLFARQNYSEK